MTRAGIVEKIQAATGMSLKDARDALEGVFSIMKTTAVNGG